MTEALPQLPPQPLDGVDPQALAIHNQQQGVDGAAYVAETLQRTEVQDTSGIEHPVYNVAGHNVTFRNRNEVTEFEQPWSILAPEDGRPVEAGGAIQVAASSWQEYLQKSSNPENAELLVATTTPEGIMAAAEQLGSPNAESLRASREGVEKGEYDETAAHVIDGMLASLVIDDNGKMREYYDTEGYGIVLAGLMGDETASAIINNKVAALYDYKATETNTNVSRLRQFIAEHEATHPETIDARNVALVHSTEHDLAYDNQGNVILRATSQHREDKLPRATLHFTVNGQVGSHLGGQWGEGNKLIVTNFQNMLEADGLPECMNPVDTYYALNPGQTLTLPDTKVVQSNTEQIELIMADGSNVTYKNSELYSDQERTQIDNLAHQYQIPVDRYNGDYSTILREVALRQTLESVGVRTFVIAQEHYSDNYAFDRAYARLASEVGVGNTTLHASTGDSGLEARSTYAMFKGNFAGWDEDMGASYMVEHEASLQALRQVVASGYIPARPAARKPADPDLALLGF